MLPGLRFFSDPLIEQCDPLLQHIRCMSWTPGHQTNAASAIESDFDEDHGYFAATLPDQHLIPEYKPTELKFFCGLTGDSQDILGAGSYAKVLWAFCSRGDQHVAVKQLHPGAKGDIQREFTLQNMCKHDYVAAVKGCVKLAGAWAMIMEKCVCSLQDALYAVHLPRAPQQPQQQQQQQFYMGSGVFQAIAGPAAEDVNRQVEGEQSRTEAKGVIEDFGNRLTLLTHIAAAVHHIHTASKQPGAPHKPCILHNDIRAHNVLLDIKTPQLGMASQQGGGANHWVAKVTDFGHAAEFQGQHGDEVVVEQHTNALWAAPEVVGKVKGRHVATLKSDIFSFGQLVQEVLTGQHPYTFPSNDNRGVQDRASYLTILLGHLAAHSSGTAPPGSTENHLKQWKDLRHSCGELLNNCTLVLRPKRAVPQAFCELVDSCRKLTPTKRPTAAQVLEKLQQIKQEYSGHQVGHIQAATAAAPAAAAAAAATAAAPAAVPINNHPVWEGGLHVSPMDWILISQPQEPATGLAAAGV